VRRVAGYLSGFITPDTLKGLVVQEPVERWLGLNSLRVTFTVRDEAAASEILALSRQLVTTGHRATH
jgi:hypothetical protein